MFLTSLYWKKTDDAESVVSERIADYQAAATAPAWVTVIALGLCVGAIVALSVLR